MVESIAAFMALATVAVTIATATGNGKALCDRLGGTYTPSAYGAEQCPGASWANAFKAK